MQINHLFDIAPEVGAKVEVLGDATFFAEADAISKDDSFDCGGTLGSAGSFGGTLGTFGCFGCCC
jgi:hypothetical protein